MNQEKSLPSEIFYSLFSLVKPRKVQNANSEWQSHVLPHSPIQELAPNLWHVTGILPASGHPPREMILYKLPDSTLLIHSGIVLDEATMIQLESLGTPKIMIVPNRIHRLDARVFKQRYPELIVVAPAAAIPYVEQVVPVDATAEEFLPQYGIVCHQPTGIRPQELTYELQLPTGKALIFTDILFNLTESYLDKYTPTTKLPLNILGAYGFFGITKLGKMFYMTDRNAYRQWLESLANNITDLQVISVAHGEPIVTNCTQKLHEAAARLNTHK
ncbi:hypothetical protein DSM106972_006420 [Dulcicalothrix desertica PCC 7102]|uniref:DUF4336 domain-containing protein n=1 Tax=Dulcicalothrix desertica PCC 7102 TaxID=232991 RepID=A0A3S1BEA2_9CYAN|nr:hypothetical protein [Dulcicalothrix desertica]RUT10147.1 hypothetical protein DSM106972_006420 [Dulcicalothrix desertica PCC 7102]TWH40874.1 hypothetical protein CAL7102_10236 [Dulcicalothrix desertica PCC 7102]